MKYIWLWAILVALGVALPVRVNADGTARVQQSDGSVQLYSGVRLRLNGEKLFLRSPDQKGTLEILEGACSFVGELQRCLPYSMTLLQHGASHVIALDRGTVYLNLTDSVHHLRYSSQRIPPHGVLVAFRTFHGTYVSVRGTLDEVQK